MANFQRDSFRALVICVFVVPTLLYGLIVISGIFDLDVPLWLVWAVTTAPPATAALVLLVRVLRQVERTRSRCMPLAHGR